MLNSILLLRFRRNSSSLRWSSFSKQKDCSMPSKLLTNKHLDVTVGRARGRAVTSQPRYLKYTDKYLTATKVKRMCSIPEQLRQHWLGSVKFPLCSGLINTLQLNNFTSKKIYIWMSLPQAFVVEPHELLQKWARLGSYFAFTSNVSMPNKYFCSEGEHLHLQNRMASYHGSPTEIYKYYY